MNFKEVINKAPAILTEGPIIERLKREFQLEMDDSKQHLDIIYKYKKELEQIYSEYLKIGELNRLPILITTPTRRINKDTMALADINQQNIIQDTCLFYNQLKHQYASYSNLVFIGGLLGCRGDGYSGEKLLSIEESYKFHKGQTLAFKDQDIDFLMASLLPEINEAIGISKALSDTKKPYIISFMLTKEGGLMDGTLLSDAIKYIDEAVEHKPLFYMSNCIHPSSLIKTLESRGNKGNLYLNRFIGIQANASSLSPQELEQATTVYKDSDTHLVQEMLVLQNHYNLKVFGGCCGTNQNFLSALAKEID